MRILNGSNSYWNKIKLKKLNCVLAFEKLYFFKKFGGNFSKF